jgi:hypothetical protein
MDEGVPPGAHGYACPLSVHGLHMARMLAVLHM